MILVVARHELLGQWRSPAGWVAAGGLALLYAWLFLLAVEGYLQNPQASGGGLTAHLLAEYLAPASGLLLLVTPLFSMRLVAGELASGSFRLLQSAPLSMAAVAGGKLLGLLALQALLVLIALSLPALLAVISDTPLDWGALAAAGLGLLLFGGACGACGLYFSCLSRQPAVAALGSLGTLLLLWLLDGAANAGAGGGELLRLLSPPAHLRSFLRGLLDSADIAYFLLFIGFFWALAARRLDNLRLLGE